MKIVLEVEDKEPTNGDIMVFNGVLNKWEYKSQDKYLIGLKNEILERKKEIENLNLMIGEIKKDLSVIAKILKEGI